MSLTPERLALAQELANTAIQINALRESLKNTVFGSDQAIAMNDAYQDLLIWRDTLVGKINSNPR